jgi:hypothetical protein
MLRRRVQEMVDNPNFNVKKNKHDFGILGEFKKD